MQTTISPFTVTGSTPKERTASILKVLEQGIRDVFTSGRYEEYLTAMSRFHHYSFRNTLLIVMQRPDATHVAGIHTWNHAFGRTVIPGSIGIRILAPSPYKESFWIERKDAADRPILDPMTGIVIKDLREIVMQSFRVVSVFDVSQTTGKPLPELASELKSHLDNATILQKAILDVAGCPIEITAIAGQAKGFYDPTHHRIVIRSGMSEAQTIKTMIHELSHSRLHRMENTADNQDKDRATMEVEAESIAFVVLKHFDIDTSEYSFGYLASWSEDQNLKELSSSLSLIQNEADSLIQLISEAMTV